MSNITVSVIMPAYNGGRYLAEAIESVLKQSRRATEILLVDDGSIDNTGAIAQSYGIRGVRYIRQEHAGYVAAVNLGVRMTEGESIAFLDADDLWCEGKLELQMAHLESNPAVDIVLGHQRRMWQKEGCQEWSYTLPELGLAMGPATVRRSVFQEAGLFDMGMSHCADWDWFFRARERGTRFLTHREVVLFYRRHDANMSEDTAASRTATVNVLKKSLDRRRALTGRAESLASVSLPESTLERGL